MTTYDCKGRKKYIKWRKENRGFWYVLTYSHADQSVFKWCCYIYRSASAVYCERQCSVSFKGEKSKCYCQKKKPEKKLNRNRQKILCIKNCIQNKWTTIITHTLGIEDDDLIIYIEWTNITRCWLEWIYMYIKYIKASSSALRSKSYSIYRLPWHRNI